jgi:ribosome-associated protein
MPDDLQVGPVRVPAEAMRVLLSRSGGPGGQNVNKVSSKVDLRVDLGRVEGLTDGQRARLVAASRLDGDGCIQIVAQRHRDQLVNLEEARERLALAIAAARPEPRRRRPTRPSRGARERRLEEKRRNSERKRDRRGD